MHSSSGTRCLTPTVKTRSRSGTTDLERGGGFFSVVFGFDAAEDEEEAEQEEDEKLRRDVCLHCLECLVKGEQVGDELSQYDVGGCEARQER